MIVSNFGIFADYKADFQSSNYPGGTPEGEYCNSAFPYDHSKTWDDPANEKHVRCRVKRAEWPPPNAPGGLEVRGLMAGPPGPSGPVPSSGFSMPSPKVLGIGAAAALGAWFLFFRKKAQ